MDEHIHRPSSGQGEVPMSPQREREMLGSSHDFEFKIQNSRVLIGSHCPSLWPGSEQCFDPFDL